MEIVPKRQKNLPNSNNLKSIKENLILCQNTTPSFSDNRLWLNNYKEVKISNINGLNKLLEEIIYKSDLKK